jgi:hypothetical protein
MSRFFSLAKTFHVAYSSEHLMFESHARNPNILISAPRPLQEKRHFLPVDAEPRDYLRADRIPIPCLVGNFLPILSLDRNFLHRSFSFIDSALA